MRIVKWIDFSSQIRRWEWKYYFRSFSSENKFDLSLLNNEITFIRKEINDKGNHDDMEMR